MKLDVLTSAVECERCGALVVEAALHHHREFHAQIDDALSSAAW